MSDVLARVKALLARATDSASAEEEKRSCAVIAARLIKQHNISIGGSSRLSPEDESLLSMIKREQARREEKRRQEETDRREADKKERERQACKADKKKRRPFYADTACPSCGKCH